jgi:hypothetical protein
MEKSTIYIDMTVNYFFNHCNNYPNFKIPCNINFEYAYDKKIKVITSILDSLSEDLEEYSDDHFYRLRKQKRSQMKRFLIHNNLFHLYS